MPRRRRNEGLLEILAECPWWVSIVFAALVYLALKYWLSAYSANNMLLAGMAKGLQHAAGLFASLFLIPAAVSFFGARKRRALLEQQSGLDSFKSLSWREFEMLCGEAFRRQGFKIQENGLGGADGGIDLILRKNGETHLVQCKRWKNSKVGVKDVRELFGIVAAEHAARGIFIASGEYTAAARDFAKGKPLDLIDGPTLVALVGTVRESGPLRPADRQEPTMETIETLAAPSCPSCGAVMVLRTAKRGSNKGSRFWGCPSFPKCRGTVNVG